MVVVVVVVCVCVGGGGLDGEGRQNGWQQGKHQRLNSGFSPGR